MGEVVLGGRGDGSLAINRRRRGDGYSKDGTRNTVDSRGVKFILQEGAGKAGALSTAFQDAPTPYVAVMDGDGSYAPSDLDRFLPSLPRFDFIKGVRNWKECMSLTYLQTSYDS